MLIQLERITFNHDPIGAGTDGFDICVAPGVPAPDWVRGATDPSPAAYALATTDGNVLTVEAHFSFPGTSSIPPGLFVRAVAASGASDVLGSVMATPINSAVVGRTAQLTLPLKSPALWAVGVGTYSVSWQWQFQISPGNTLSEGNWIGFDQSRHTIYVAVDVPDAPWKQGAGQQLRWPLTRALGIATDWAGGITLDSTHPLAAKQDAADLIETKLYDLGKTEGLQYNTNGHFVGPNGSNQDVFRFSAFLDLVESKSVPGSDTTVNCSDCAAGVATLANAIGCGLILVRLKRKPPKNKPQEVSFFKTNPVVPIGPASKPVRETFSYHDIAAIPATAAAARQVHDACLKIDRDSNPASSRKSDFRLAEGLAQGSMTASKHLKYAQRVIRAADLKKEMLGDPQVFPCLEACDGTDVANPQLAELWSGYNELIAQTLSPFAGHQAAVIVDLAPPHIQGFFAYDVAVDPPHFTAMRGLVIRAADFFYTATPLRANRRTPKQRLRVSVVYCQTPELARRALAWVLTASASYHHVVRAGVKKIGDAAFANSRHSTAFSILSSAIVRVANIGHVVADPIRPLQAVIAAQRLEGRPGRPAVPPRIRS